MIELTVIGVQHRVDAAEDTLLHLPFSPDRVGAARESGV